MLLLTLAIAAASPGFDPLRFFAGETRGEGRLHIALHHTRAVRVEGHGRRAGDALVLDQTVRQAGKPATTREWRLRRVGPGRYAGTLTDARGPVSAESIGDRLHIAYRGAGGLRFEQWLTLAPDGRSARNRLTARKLGITVARLDETITKAD